MLLQKCLDGLFGRVGDLCWPARGLQLRFVDGTVIQKVLLDMVNGRGTAADVPGNVFRLPFVEKETNHFQAFFVGEYFRHWDSLRALCLRAYVQKVVEKAPVKGAWDASQQN